MSRPITFLAALSPAALATAWVAVEMARIAYERRDAAEDEATRLEGALSEARSALADLQREYARLHASFDWTDRELTTANQSIEHLRDTLEGGNEAGKIIFDERAAARAEVERLTAELAREDEQNTADRETAARLRAELEQVTRQRDTAIDRVAFLAMESNDRLNRITHVEAERDAAIADAAQARAAEQAASAREAARDRGHAAELGAMRERAERTEAALVQRTAELDTCAGGLAIANRQLATLRAAPIESAAEAAPAVASIEPLKGDTVVLVREPFVVNAKAAHETVELMREISASRTAEAAVVPAVASVEPLCRCGRVATHDGLCDQCDAKIENAINETPFGRTGIAQEPAPTQDDPFPGACRTDAPNGPECHCGKPSAIYAGLCAEHARDAEQRWRDDRDDQAVRELLSRGPATWEAMMATLNGGGGRYDRATRAAARLRIEPLPPCTASDVTLYSPPTATPAAAQPAADALSEGAK